MLEATKGVNRKKDTQYNGEREKGQNDKTGKLLTFSSMLWVVLLSNAVTYL
jgi:hypothetical protein